MPQNDRFEIPSKAQRARVLRLDALYFLLIESALRTLTILENANGGVEMKQLALSHVNHRPSSSLVRELCQ